MAQEFPFRHVPPADPNIGRRVDRYFVLRQLLGAGGMGAAYLAEHELMPHVKCVVKLVLAEQANQPAVMARWTTETSACSLLSKHENIVKLENLGQLDDGQPFMRFEYIAGAPLHHHVKAQGGRLSVRDATYIIIQVCDALDYAHACGVVHRDLKPDNLMIELDPPGSKVALRVKVLDFGIAKVSTVEQTAAGVVMGTPGFMAPEQATNAAAATGKADVFALATVFYRAVTGAMPWGPVESAVAICIKQLQEPPNVPPVSLMSPEVAAVVLRALSVRVDDRPTMKEFAQQLAAAIPAERHLPSGLDILREIKRSWATSWPPHGPTVPRPIEEPDPDVVGDSGGVVPNVAAGASDGEPAQDPPREPANIDVGPSGPGALVGRSQPSASRSDLVITANVRRRSTAPPLAAAERATLTPTSSPHAAFAAQSTSQQGQPIAAALPTGLFSQRFAAQEPPPDAVIREESIIVASEFEMAIGTPTGPHGSSQLPAVVVSNTLLTQGASSASVELAAETISPAASSDRLAGARSVEPPPIVVFPRPPRGPARKLWLVGAAVCVTVAVVGFGMVRSRASRDDANGVQLAPVVERRDVGAPISGAARRADNSDVAGASPVEVVLAPAADAVSPKVHPAEETIPTKVSTGGRPSGESANIALAEGSAKPALPGTSEAGARPLVRPAAKPAAELAAPAGEGELVISVKPWAAVWINGRAVPEGTPYRGRLPAGRYRIRLANEDNGQNEVIPVTIEPNKTKTIERKW